MTPNNGCSGAFGGEMIDMPMLQDEQPPFDRAVYDAIGRQHAEHLERYRLDLGQPQAAKGHRVGEAYNAPDKLIWLARGLPTGGSGPEGREGRGGVGKRPPSRTDMAVTNTAQRLVAPGAGATGGVCGVGTLGRVLGAWRPSAATTWKGTARIWKCCGGWRGGVSCARPGAALVCFRGPHVRRSLQSGPGGGCGKSTRSPTS
jgi:hypothetical protein